MLRGLGKYPRGHIARRVIALEEAKTKSHIDTGQAQPAKDDFKLDTDWHLPNCVHIGRPVADGSGTLDLNHDEDNWTQSSSDNRELQRRLWTQYGLAGSVPGCQMGKPSYSAVITEVAKAWVQCSDLDDPDSQWK